VTVFVYAYALTCSTVILLLSLRLRSRLAKACVTPKSRVERKKRYVEDKRQGIKQDK
jgi:hypothetical protein